MGVFDEFTTSNYTFLRLDSGSGGNKVITEYPANGIVKLRDGLVQADNVESFDSASTIHVRPNEAFIAVVGGNLVGHGIKVEKGNHDEENYRIIGQVEGYDFDTDTLEFYKVTLKRESIWESDLPLE